MPTNPAVVSVNEYVLIAAALAVFGSIGFRRGVNRELVTFVAVLIALAAASLFSQALLPVVNQLYRMVRLVLNGGLSAENPAAAWDAVKQLPDLVQSPGSVAVLQMVVFMIPIAISYLIGRRFRAPVTPGQRLLGLLMGAVSGFFIAQHFIPLLFPAGQTRLELATGPATHVLQDTQVVAVLVVVTVVILIAFGLYSSRRVEKK